MKRIKSMERNGKEIELLKHDDYYLLKINGQVVEQSFSYDHMDWLFDETVEGRN